MSRKAPARYEYHGAGASFFLAVLEATGGSAQGQLVEPTSIATNATQGAAPVFPRKRKAGARGAGRL